MKPDELYARLLIADDATAEVIALFNEVDWPTALANVPKDTREQAAARKAAHNAARGAAWGAAREAAWGAALDAALDAAREAAYDAGLLASCMVVRDLLAKKHMDAALALACRWLAYITEGTKP